MSGHVRGETSQDCLVRGLVNESDRPRHGAVGILVEDERFLVIRRSRHVRAPNLLCFAGGSLDPGETPEQTVVRELEEELALNVRVQRYVWQSTTQWGTLLDWLLVERIGGGEPRPNPAEVSEWMWLAADELLTHPDRLPSVPQFFVEWAKGTFELPSIAGLPNPAWLELEGS